MYPNSNTLSIDDYWHKFVDRWLYIDLCLGLALCHSADQSDVWMVIAACCLHLCCFADSARLEWLATDHDQLSARYTAATRPTRSITAAAPESAATVASSGGETISERGCVE